MLQTDLYIRSKNIAPGNLPVGVSPDIASIDSVKYQSYINSQNNPGQQGIINVDADLKSQNEQYIQQMQTIVQQIMNLYNNLFNANLTIDNLMSQYREGFVSSNKTEDENVYPSVLSSSLKESFSTKSMPYGAPRKSLVQEYNDIEAQVKILSENRNMDNIIEDRGLVATQQNYLYVLVLILTLGTITFFYKFTKKR
jgi:hypothetical protein